MKCQSAFSVSSVIRQSNFPLAPGSSDWLSASLHCQVLLQGVYDLRWTLALPLPSVTVSWVYTPSGPLMSHGVCVFFGGDGVGPSVNCVWPHVSSRLHTHSPSHTYTQTRASLVGYTLLTAWWDDLPLSERPLWFWGRTSHHLMRRSQKEMACEKERGYNSNSHCISFWFTAQLAINLLYHIQQSYKGFVVYVWRTFLFLLANKKTV